MRSYSPLVLVIDDDVQFLDYMSTLMEKNGYRVCSAVNGEEGMERYAQLQPQLIITDIFMSKKEGLEVIMDIRKHDLKIPIVAVSGDSHKFGRDYIRMAKKLGADAVFLKPFDSADMLATVKEFFTVD